MKRFPLICAATLLILSGFSSAHAGLMPYYNVDEAEARLMELDGSPFARLFRIGYSYDYTADPNDPYRYPVYALRISADGDDVEDNYRKNAILFECGMHPREWLSIESCMRLAGYLVEKADGQRSTVAALLSEVDVWIIPMSNPAGRYLDSPGGDPTLYATSPSRKGWRGNGDTRLCNYGVNVARNFSRGFDDTLRGHQHPAVRGEPQHLHGGGHPQHRPADLEPMGQRCQAGPHRQGRPLHGRIRQHHLEGGAAHERHGQIRPGCRGGRRRQRSALRLVIEAIGAV